MLSHVDDSNQPKIVDVSHKEVTRRTALARTIVSLTPEIAALLQDGDIGSKKGPVFQTAIIAGVMGAKRTSELIPLCHHIALEDCAIDIQLNASHDAVILCSVTAHHKTGVEMEALTGASIAALTVYDMCKAMSKDIIIRETRLLEKRGGKSDYDHSERG